jgi:hypothetical protein
MHPKRTMPKKFSIWYSHRITRRRKLWSQAKSRSTRQRCFAIRFAFHRELARNRPLHGFPAPGHTHDS